MKKKVAAMVLALALGGGIGACSHSGSSSGNDRYDACIKKARQRNQESSPGKMDEKALQQAAAVTCAVCQTNPDGEFCNAVMQALK